MAQPASEASTRMLYKRLLRAVERYPSVKRETIYQSVREEFRENAGESNQERISEMRRAAIESLRQLQQYAAMDDSKQHLELQLTGAPLQSKLYA